MERKFFILVMWDYWFVDGKICKSWKELPHYSNTIDAYNTQFLDRKILKYWEEVQIFPSLKEAHQAMLASIEKKLNAIYNLYFDDNFDITTDPSVDISLSKASISTIIDGKTFIAEIQLGDLDVSLLTS